MKAKDIEITLKDAIDHALGILLDPSIREKELQYEGETARNNEQFELCLEMRGEQLVATIDGIVVFQEEVYVHMSPEERIDLADELAEIIIEYVVEREHDNQITSRIVEIMSSKLEKSAEVER